MICGPVQAFAIMLEIAHLIHPNAVPAFFCNREKHTIYPLSFSEKNSSGFFLIRILQWWGAVNGWKRRRKQVL